MNRTQIVGKVVLKAEGDYIYACYSVKGVEYKDLISDDTPIGWYLARLDVMELNSMTLD
jgi:hypothetical protein